MLACTYLRLHVKQLSPTGPGVSLCSMKQKIREAAIQGSQITYSADKLLVDSCTRSRSVVHRGDPLGLISIVGCARETQLDDKHTQTT